MITRRALLGFIPAIAALGLVGKSSAAEETFTEQYGATFKAGMDTSVSMPAWLKPLLDVSAENIAVRMDGRILSREYWWMPARRLANDPLAQEAYAGVKVFVARPMRYYRAPELDGWFVVDKLKTPKAPHLTRIEVMDHEPPGGTLVRYAREVRS